MTASSLFALDWALRGGTVALTALTAGALIRAYPAAVSARLGALFALGAAAYAIVSASGFHGGGAPWQIPLLAGPSIAKRSPGQRRVLDPQR